MRGRVTLNAPDTPHIPLQDNDDGPAFDEPWQAQVIGIADRLVHAGVLSSQDWAEGLGRQLRNAKESGAPDNKSTYYCAVLTTLEDLLGGSGAIGRDELDARVQSWREAYLATPHGRPVELSEPARLASTR
jgi:nitrile hydratase accessory protein